jgi:hypothetical protein
VDAPDPELQAARALTREQAEVAAREILKAAAPLLAPRKFIDPKTRKLREFRADDLDPLELIEGESSCERLYRLARSKLAYHQARSREMLEQLKVEQGLRGLAFPSDRLAVLAKATSAYDRVLRDIARPYSTLGRSPSLRSFEKLAMATALDEHMRLARQLSTPYSPLSQIRNTVDKIVGLKPMSPMLGATRFLNEAASWDRILKDQFGFVGTLSRSSASLTRASSGTARAAELAVLNPGFRAVAMLGIEGVIARGAAADILAHYEDRSGEATSPFSSTLAGITIIDTAEEDPAAAAGALEAAWAILLGMLDWVKDEVQRAGLIALLALLVAVHADWVAMQPQETSGPVPGKIDTLTSEVTALRMDIAARSAQADNGLRYVHAPAPLRADPNGKALLIRLIYPDQILRLIERNGDWAKVEAYDYPSDQPVRGWVHRRNLRRLPAG